jgi:hypothetical protein
MTNENGDGKSVVESPVPPSAPVTKQIEISTRDIDYEFQVDGEQVQEFASELSEARQGPSLEPPASILSEKVDVPDGWNCDRVVHTGGGFWRRRFQKPCLDGHIEVIYNVTALNGVSASAFDSEGFHLEEIRVGRFLQMQTNKTRFRSLTN